MTFYNPILIAGPARSGTSMIANLLYRHGVWIGDARKSKVRSIPENVGTENTEIKNLLKNTIRTVGHTNKETLVSAQDQKTIDTHTFISAVFVNAPGSQPWLIKTSLLLDFHQLFITGFPGARWVLPYRDQADILKSVANHPKMRRRRWDTAELVDASHKRQNEIFNTASNAIRVHSEHIIYSTAAARDLLEFCQLPFSMDAYKQAVSPGRWKGWASDE